MDTKEEERSFSVSVFTGNQNNAGTDSNVFIRLFGEAGTCSSPIKLDSIKDNFERGKRDDFQLSIKGITGKISKIQIVFSKGINPAWFLCKVIIREGQDKYTFLCNRWIDPSNDKISNHELFPIDVKDTLTVIILEARALPGMDIIGSRSTPCAVVKYGSQSYQTAVQSKTLNPVFHGFPATFSKEEGIDSIEIQLWNSESILPHKSIGNIKLKLSDIPMGAINDRWYDIYQAKKATEPKKKFSFLLCSPNSIVNSVEDPSKDVKHIFGEPVVHVRIYNGKEIEEPIIDHSVFFDNSILEQIQSGDVIAFCGRSALARLIKTGTDTPYSHLGIILRMIDPRDPSNGEQLFIMESTQNAWKVKDYITEEVHKGVTIFKFTERLRKIDSISAWHIPLNTPLSSNESDKLAEFCLELHKKGIKYDTKQLVEFLLGFKNEENLSELFCSEFVAMGLRHVGRLPGSNPSAMTPCDVIYSNEFSTKGPTPVNINMLRIQVEDAPMSII